MKKQYVKGFQNLLVKEKVIGAVNIYSIKIIGDVILYEGFEVAILLNSKHLPETIKQKFKDILLKYEENIDNSYEDGYYYGSRHE